MECLFSKRNIFSTSIHFFNPDNDLALAAFDENYTAPASARKMTEDLAILPLWYAENGSAIHANSDKNRDFLQRVQSLFPEKLSTMRLQESCDCNTQKIHTWGWNPSLRKHLITCGVPENQLPTIADLYQLREYSHRKHAVKMLATMRAKYPDCCGESHLFTTVEELMQYLASHNKGDTLLKMPLSGSGKGIIRIIDNITDKQTDWCVRVLKKQGAIVVEPFLHKVVDFAMEFSLSRKTIAFEGYSLFQTAASGAYIGNTLLSDNAIEKHLTHYVNSETIHRLKVHYLHALPAYFPYYKGIIGVDMMICKSNDVQYCVQPCVEINMRMNMGLVAHRLREKFVHPDCEGQFIIDFFKKEGFALAFHRKMKTQFPLHIEKERITSGYLNLNPIDGHTNYVAYVRIFPTNN